MNKTSIGVGIAALLIGGAIGFSGTIGKDATAQTSVRVLQDGKIELTTEVKQTAELSDLENRLNSLQTDLSATNSSCQLNTADLEQKITDLESIINQVK